MSTEELKQRLNSAVAKVGGIPQNFWWALLQVALELRCNGEPHTLQELKDTFSDIRIPVALHKLLHEGYYHPGCAEDLKIRAQVEAAEVEISRITALHQELHRMFGLTCRYTVWKPEANLYKHCFVGFSTESMNTFLDKFLSKPTNEDDKLIELVTKPGNDSKYKGDFTYLARVYIALHEHHGKGLKIPTKVVEELREYQDTFLWESIRKGVYSDDIEEQCREALRSIRTKGLEKVLLDRWMRIVNFLPNARLGKRYYYPDITSEEGCMETKWYGVSDDTLLLSKGLCFDTKEAAITFYEMMA